MKTIITHLKTHVKQNFIETFETGQLNNILELLLNILLILLNIKHHCDEVSKIFEQWRKQSNWQERIKAETEFHLK